MFATSGNLRREFLYEVIWSPNRPFAGRKIFVRARVLCVRVRACACGVVGLWGCGVVGLWGCVCVGVCVGACGLWKCVSGYRFASPLLRPDPRVYSRVTGTSSAQYQSSLPSSTDVRRSLVVCAKLSPLWYDCCSCFLCSTPPPHPLPCTPLGVCPPLGEGRCVRHPRAVRPAGAGDTGCHCKG